MKIKLISPLFLILAILLPQSVAARDAEVLSSSLLGPGQGQGIALDKKGYIYITGKTYDKDFPCVNAIQDFLNGSTDAFVMKLSPAGDQIIYSTFIGGSGDDEARNIAVDDAGQVYITGNTQSDDFPLVNPAQSKKGDAQATFVLKLNAEGNKVLYSTFLGGARLNTAFSIAVDPKQNIYVTGWTESLDFPIKNAIQPVYGGGSNDMYVTKIKADGQLGYSTYLGGGNGEEGYDIAVDKQGYAHVVGFSASPSFPVLNSVQKTLRGEKDSTLIKLSPQGQLVYSILFGGSDEENFEGVALDSRGNVYVTGWTHSADYPTRMPFQAHFAGTRDATVAKFDSKGKLLFSSYLGGKDQDVGIRISLNERSQSMSITGEVWSQDFPTVKGFQNEYGGGDSDAFITALSLDGQKVFYSSYLGGEDFETARAVAVMPTGETLISGLTSSQHFPVANPLIERARGIFFTKVAPPSVNHPPALLPIPNNLTVPAGRKMVLKIVAKDPDRDKITLKARLANGDPLSSIGAGFHDYGDGTGVFYWTPSPRYIGRGAIFFFTARDPDGLQSSQVSYVKVGK